MFAYTVCRCRVLFAIYTAHQLIVSIMLLRFCCMVRRVCYKYHTNTETHRQAESGACSTSCKAQTHTTKRVVSVERLNVRILIMIIYIHIASVAFRGNLVRMCVAIVVC